ncbi:MAG: TIGR04255 family protein [Chloroflexi bacterium]|nr:MAG: TIGR04255 family protein [Chloroflexota bacterium]
MSAQREVYPRAPLRLVVAELRYPYAPRLASSEAVERLTTMFRPIFPLPEPTGMQVVMALGGTSQTQSSPSAVNRFLARDRTSSVTVSPQNIVIETTVYSEYEKFRPLLETCLGALGEIEGAIVGLERVGLRYINEIRVPALRNHTEWSTFLASPLIASLALIPNRDVALTQSVVQTEPRENVTTLVRYGALRGQVVSAAGPLQVAALPPTSPFFLLDIDNSWSSHQSYDEYSVQSALDICDRLHGPIDELFESAITDDLREVFRRTE